MKTLLMLITAIWISGCATSAPLKEISQSGPSTAELMRHGSSTSTNSSISMNKQLYEVNYNDYTRTASNELDMLFPRLPNPVLVMYVYPHLSSAGVPVPGYSTAFKLYESDQYALPGETPYNVR